MKDRAGFSRKVTLYNAAFGICVIVGGAIGFFKAGSLISLVSGLITGGLLLLAAWGMKPSASRGQGVAPALWGLFLAEISAVALLVMFTIRLIDTGKLFPALPILLLALGAMLLNTYLLHQRSLEHSTAQEEHS